LNGEPEPLQRRFRGINGNHNGYEDMEQYQERFHDNFPLLY
jgi:hypothetical protein